MMNALDHPLVQDYLGRLHEETVRLRVDEGRELETQIREHLTEALGADPTEASVREVLDRLGEPAELVDAAGGAPPGPGPASGGDARYSPWREAGALLALVGAALLFWLPPVNVLLLLGGLVLLAIARRWTVTEKVWGAIVLGFSWWFLILVSAVSFSAGGPQSCTSDAAGATVCTGGNDGLSPLNIIAISATVLWVALYLWTLFHLARSASRNDD